MRNFIPPEDSAHSGSTHSPPLTPVQNLRAAIGRCADCLTRMLDAVQGDGITAFAAEFLVDKSCALENEMIELDELIMQIADQFDSDDDEDYQVEPDELVELTQPTRNPAAEERGVS